MDDRPRLPLIGEKAPPFRAASTQGEIDFPDDYRGKWVVFFSHPADFTPVCTTEFIAFARAEEEFRNLNAQLLGLSVDSIPSHIAWLRAIRALDYGGEGSVEITFPVLSDPTAEVASRYGMVHPLASTTQTVRATFIIDPDGIVRAVLYYPPSNGRSIPELKRLLLALQRSAEQHVVTPADWQPGQEVIAPPPESYREAQARMEQVPPGSRCLDWFLCLREDPGGREGKRR